VGSFTLLYVKVEFSFEKYHTAWLQSENVTLYIDARRNIGKHQDYFCRCGCLGYFWIRGVLSELQHIV
jgi:hypothetical protein